MTQSPKPRMLSDPKEAFPHVIDSHRWLAASGCNWNLLTTNGSKIKAAATCLLPNVDVMVRDCALVHARSLIKFYTEGRSSDTDTDIKLCDFDKLSISSELKTALDPWKRRIEVHLFHLTAWRDLAYRNEKGTDETRTRPETWDTKIGPIVDLILSALKCASEETSSWKKPFAVLHEATVARCLNESFKWPCNLLPECELAKFLSDCNV